jgi:hypothetical protein
VRGVTLRNHLKGGAPSFHDDDPWIHIVSFGDSTVPFELIYTHKMPDDDREVPVCDTALAGAVECTSDCPDRSRSDRCARSGSGGRARSSSVGSTWLRALERRRRCSVGSP